MGARVTLHRAHPIKKFCVVSMDSTKLFVWPFVFVRHVRGASHGIRNHRTFGNRKDTYPHDFLKGNVSRGGSARLPNIHMELVCTMAETM